MGTLAKPKFGERCNGCGYCCEREQCLISIELFGKREGPCVALEREDGRTYCGVVRHAPSDLQPQIAYWLGLGVGCDASDDSEIPAV
jgi:hypothetical protein